MNKAVIAKPEYKAFLLVRDKDGVPRFDDPENAPQELKNALTDEDLRRMDPSVVMKLGLSHRMEK